MKMNTNKLIGKWAIRTKPMIYENGVKDWSYTDDPVFILKVDDSHILYKHYLLENKEPYILDNRWNDNNWIDYKKLVALPWWIKLLKLIAYRFIK